MPVHPPARPLLRCWRSIPAIRESRVHPGGLTLALPLPSPRPLATPHRVARRPAYTVDVSPGTVTLRHQSLALRHRPVPRPADPYSVLPEASHVVCGRTKCPYGVFSTDCQKPTAVRSQTLLSVAAGWPVRGCRARVLARLPAEMSRPSSRTRPGWAASRPYIEYRVAIARCPLGGSPGRRRGGLPAISRFPVVVRGRQKPAEHGVSAQ